MKYVKSLAAAAIMFSSGVNANNIPESPSIDSFDTIAPSFVQEKKKFNDNEMLSLKTNKVLSVDKIIEEKKSGVYISPTDDNEVVVLNFKTKNAMKTYKDDEAIYSYLEENKYLESDEEKKDLKAKNSVKNSDKRSSFFMMGEVYNEKYSYISLSDESIKAILEDARSSENNYSKEMIDFLPKAILYHELAHSHKHQRDSMKDVVVKYREIKEKGNDYSGFKKESELVSLGGENYSDSFMLINMAIMMKNKYGSEKGINLHDELYKFFDEEFRYDGDKEYYNTHATRAVLKATKDFIDNNWEVIEGFKTEKDSKNLEKISASITNGTLNHPSIAPINSSKYSQNEAERNGGLSYSILREASKDVNKGLQEMVTLEGDKVSFTYKPNIHKEYKDTLRHNRH